MISVDAQDVEEEKRHRGLKVSWLRSRLVLRHRTLSRLLSNVWIFLSDLYCNRNNGKEYLHCTFVPTYKSSAFAHMSLRTTSSASTQEDMR
jgi:hypothetical protein